MIENELPRLTREAREAADAFGEISQRWEARNRVLSRRVTEQLNEELGPEFRTKRDARARAEQELRTEQERVIVASAQEILPYPEGTELVEWMPAAYNWESRSFHKTGMKGVLQVKRSTDLRPDNKRYEIEVGAVVVRYLLTNGKPGKRCVRFARGIWLKDGEIHDKCRLLPCPSCNKDRPADGVRVKFAPGNVCPNCGHIEPDGKENDGKVLL